MSGTGVISAEDAISYGITGPFLRATGVDYDVRKDCPYAVYDRLIFDVPVGTRGDNMDRYLVRMEEMEQSMRIVESALREIPKGSVLVNPETGRPIPAAQMVDLAKVGNISSISGCSAIADSTLEGSDRSKYRSIATDEKRAFLPPKEDTYGNIEGLMRQFKLVMMGHGVRPPKGEAYFPVEGANGELGFYVISDGSGSAYRVRVRPPCFAIMSALPKLLIGDMLADVVPTFGSVRQCYEQPKAAMLPILWLIQNKQGYICAKAEAWAAQFLGVARSHVREVVSFYNMFHTKPVGRRELRVCTSLPCLLRGSDKVLEHIKDRLNISPGETTQNQQLTLTEVECLCACEMSPMAQLDETFIGPLDGKTLDVVLRSALENPKNSAPLLVPEPYISTDGPVLSHRFKKPEGSWLKEYLADGGYVAAKKVLTSMTPQQVIDEISKSNLRGLGGAGFPTGRKWSFVPKDTTKPKYLVVNADEGEPGTFKDRYILERDPHALLEGMIISAYAIGSHKAYVYIRGEYFRPAKRLQQAVDEAYRAGWLGKKIQGTGFDLDVVIHSGAGAYICGEETALLTSLEGGKGFPKLKPPFPAISGLFSCPTIVNNVETLACVPFIIRNGAEQFAKIGTPKQGGTRLFCISGHVVRPGVYERPVSIRLRELIEKDAGGICNGKKLKAVIPGGISAKILTANEIDVSMDFDSLLAAGTMAGSGGVIVMDETTSMVEALGSAAKFFAHESCGQCSPCREGTGWVKRILDRIMDGRGTLQDLDELLAIASDMEGNTICVFADAAAWPVQSYIMKFRDEFERFIRSGRGMKSKRSGYKEEVATCPV